MSDAPFDPDRIRNQAVAATGLDDWGDRSVHEGLEILCSSLRDEGNLNAKGAARLSSRILGAMIQRLKVIEDHKSIDGLSSVPIPRPIIVTGNGRSGTTLMHKLIAGCEGNRPVLTWEMRRPSPPPEAASWETDPRIDEIEREMEADGYKQPDAMARHHFGADQAEECSTLLELAGVGGIYGALARAPSYTRYRETVDFHAPYRFHKMVLQELALRGPQGRMVIKAPEHMFHLPELLDIYPDAVVVQMHRDPARVMPSLISVVGKMQSLYADTVDYDTIRDLRMSYADIMNALPDIRAGLDRPGRFVDVHYLDLVRDPAGTVERIYTEAGLPFAEGSRRNIDAHMQANPRNRFGVHTYSLSDYGLTTADVDRAFTPYIERNGIRLERAEEPV
jgi:hypothetical protein